MDLFKTTLDVLGLPDTPNPMEKNNLCTGNRLVALSLNAQRPLERRRCTETVFALTGVPSQSRNYRLLQLPVNLYRPFKWSGSTTIALELGYVATMGCSRATRPRTNLILGSGPAKIGGNKESSYLPLYAESVIRVPDRKRRHGLPAPYFGDGELCLPFQEEKYHKQTNLIS